MADTTGVVRLHSLGDVVMAQPAATALSLSGPVTFFTRPEYAPVVERMPGEILPATVDSEGGVQGLITAIASSGADRVIDLQGSTATRLAIGSRRLAGRFRMDRRLRRAVLGGADAVMPLRSREFMDAAGVSGSPSPVLERLAVPGREGSRAGIVCGGRWPMKTIPDGIVAEVCRILADVHSAETVLLGGPDDLEAACAIASSGMRTPPAVRAGAGGVGTLMEDIERLDVLISPDSGPAHLAAALGVPVVVVFTSTSPDLGFWEPGMSGAYSGGVLDCRPCHRHGGRTCRTGTGLCRSTLVPRELAGLAMEMTTA